MNPKPRPLRILQVNSCFGGGGADNQTLELSLGLRELGEEVTLAVPAGCPMEPLARRLGLAVETFPDPSPLRSAMTRRLAAIVRARRIQILHAHQGRDYWPTILAARLTGRARVVVTRHLMTRPTAFSRWFLLRFAHVVAVSRAVETVCRCELRGPARHLHQVYAGIDPARFQSERTAAAAQFRQRQGWPAEAVAFGVVGFYNLPRGKGHLEFLEAAARLRSDFPNGRFAIIGSGSLEPVLRQTITRLDLGGVVSMVPFTADIPLVMNALDALVHPAVGTEALSLVILEALASGRPAIASRLDGIPETFIEGEHGLLVPAGDVAALTGAMRTFLENPELRRRFGAAGPKHVRASFSRSRLAESVAELYLRLCAREG